MLQVGLADRGDSTAHLQVCLCSEARRKNPRVVSWWEKKKQPLVVSIVSLQYACCMVVVGGRNATQVCHPSTSVTLLGSLAVLVHTTFVEHRKQISFCPIPSCRAQAMFPSDQCCETIIGWIWMIQARAGWLFCSKPWLWKGASEVVCVDHSVHNLF